MNTRNIFLTSCILLLKFTFLLSQKVDTRHFVTISKKVKNKLCDKKWELIKIDETLNADTHSYKKQMAHDRTSPVFNKSGGFVDLYSKGRWSSYKKMIEIKIDTVKSKFPEHSSFQGKLYIKEITDSSLIIQKNIDRIGTWTKIFYFVPTLDTSIRFGISFTSPAKINFQEEKFSTLQRHCNVSDFRFTQKNNSLNYTINTLKTFTQADVIRELLIEMGITDAFVIAFNKGKRISLSKAMITY